MRVRPFFVVCRPAQDLDCYLHGCPCGFHGDLSHDCVCSPFAIQRYRAKLSGPLLDRIDIHIDVPAVPYKELAGGASGEASAVIRERVNAARQRQLARFGDKRGTFCNAQMESADLRRFCELDVRGHDLLKLAMTKLGLSARAYDRVLKVARTIADLEGVDDIRPEHVSEAIQYRSMDRSPWG